VGERAVVSLVPIRLPLPNRSPKSAKSFGIPRVTSRGHDFPASPGSLDEVCLGAMKSTPSFALR
jgi:hypothetical protein